MSNKLNLIKKLHAEGASIRMIDDVAAFVGDYESPVFVATVEFIIKIKDMLKSVKVEKTQGVVIEAASQNKIDDALENVSFDAAKSAVNNDEELPEDERFQMLETISAVELQHLETKEVEIIEVQPKDDQKKKLKTAKRNEKAGKSSLLERLEKFRQSLKNRQQQQQNQDLHSDEKQHAARQNAAVKTQSVNKAQSHAGMRLLKLDFLKTLKIKKDPTMVGDQIYKNYKQSREFIAKPEVKTDPAQKIQKVGQEVVVSKLIDDLVKAPKQNKIEAQADKPIKTEKGKFEAKVESASQPKADAEKVAKQTAKEAIEALQKSGVKQSAYNPKVEAEVKVDSKITVAKTEKDHLAQNQNQQLAQQKHR